MALIAIAWSGCGESDSTSGGTADTNSATTSNPAANVPTVGSEDTPGSDSGALGGAGPSGGQSGSTGGTGATGATGATGGSSSGGY